MYIYFKYSNLYQGNIVRIVLFIVLWMYNYLLWFRHSAISSVLVVCSKHNRVVQSKIDNKCSIYADIL